jgi:ABC-2 type transport system permease protein
MFIADRSFNTLLWREVLRFMRVWTQTIIPPLITAGLYLVIFGLALGSRIREIEGIPYIEYIVPGIAMLNLITGSYMNTSSSVFDAKRDRYIDDILVSPMSSLQVALAYTLGGMLRGLIVGAGVFVLGVLATGVEVAHPLLLIPIAVAVSFAFSAAGVVAGVLATRIDHISFMSNVVIQPLTFLGGVFYSVDMLPPGLRVVTLIDPIFHTVDAFRFAALGVSDLTPYPTVGIVAFLAALALAGAWWAIERGPHLRS